MFLPLSSSISCLSRFSQQRHCSSAYQSSPGSLTDKNLQHFSVALASSDSRSDADRIKLCPPCPRMFSVAGESAQEISPHPGHTRSQLSASPEALWPCCSKKNPNEPLSSICGLMHFPQMVFLRHVFAVLDELLDTRLWELWRELQSESRHSCMNVVNFFPIIRLELLSNPLSQNLVGQ